MKKSLMLMLGLCSIILLAGCKDQDVENPDITDQGSDVVAVDNPQIQEDLIGERTSLTIKDLENIEQVLPPLSYTYEVYDREAQEIVSSGSYQAVEGEEPVFTIPEYENMASREVISSGIEDDMIYTITRFTTQEGDQFDVLYVNEPDTLLCRAISVEDGNKSVLYSNFIYEADIK